MNMMKRKIIQFVSFIRLKQLCISIRVKSIEIIKFKMKTKQIQIVFLGGNLYLDLDDLSHWLDGCSIIEFHSINLINWFNTSIRSITYILIGQCIWCRGHWNWHQFTEDEGPVLPFLPLYTQCEHNHRN